MSDIQLFRLHGSGTVTELASHAAPLEKTLQTRIEDQMEVFLGVRFLATEYSTGRTHRGRIDSLGLDENGCPVIVEYKRYSTENVINQGLFYLDWLLDHQAEFRWMVMEKFGKETAERIEWEGTRLLCIASDFTRYDQHAVQQIPRNIELIRYKLFGDDLLLLELVNAQSVPDATAVKRAPTSRVPTEANIPKPTGQDKSLTEQLALATPEVRTIYEQITSLLLSLGDDVQQKELKLYTAFRRLKNFACMFLKNDAVVITLKLDPNTVTLEEGFSRDVSKVGHWGTGDLMLYLHISSDLERAQPLLERSYAEN
jgi:predicted transport protein